MHRITRPAASALDPQRFDNRAPPREDDARYSSVVSSVSVSSLTSPSMNSGGLRLGSEDFAAPADVGSSYLFERLLGWGVALGVRLRAGGVRLELGAPAPDDGARELFFVRARPKPVAGPSLGSRTEIHKARPAGVAYLSFRLGEDAVEVAFVVPAKARAERAHLERLLVEKPRLVLDALAALPLNFVVGTSKDGAAGARARRPVPDVDRAELSSLLQKHETLWIGWTVPRAAVLAHQATAGGELEAAMLALGQLFRQVAWLQRATPSSATAGAATGKTRHREPRVREVADEGEPEPRSAPMTADDRLALLRGARAAARPDARASLRLRSSAGGRPARVTTRTATITSGAGASYAAASAGARHRSRPPAAPGAVDLFPGLDRGAEVEVLAGPFIGRVGVVQEIDAKGDARVLFGLLATRIAAKDLALSGRDAARPSLGSSHRKGR